MDLLPSDFLQKFHLIRHTLGCASHESIEPSRGSLKVQAIRPKGQNPKLYVYFPIPLAAAIGLQPGEEVEWELLDRGELHLVRKNASPPRTRQRASAT